MFFKQLNPFAAKEQAVQTPTAIEKYSEVAEQLNKKYANYLFEVN